MNWYSLLIDEAWHRVVGGQGRHTRAYEMQIKCAFTTNLLFESLQFLTSACRFNISIFPFNPLNAPGSFMSLWRPSALHRIKWPHGDFRSVSCDGVTSSACRVIGSNSGWLKRRQQLKHSLGSSLTDGPARKRSVWLDHTEYISSQTDVDGDMFWYLVISGLVYCESDSEVLTKKASQNAKRS